MDTNQTDNFLLLTLQSFLENSPDMIFAKDTDLVYVAASKSFAKMMGLEKGADMIGKTDFDIFETQLAKKYTVDDRNILTSEASIVDYIEPLPDQDGKKSYSSTSKYVIRDTDGRVIGLYGVARDVTAQVELECERESSRLSRQMYDDVLEADLVGNRMLRAEGSEWLKGLRITEDSLFSDTVTLLASQYVHPDYVKEFLTFYNMEQLVSAYQKGMQEFKHMTYLCTNGTSYRWVEFNSKVYLSKVSGTLRITTFLKDMDEEVRNQRRLQKKAATDALTGLHNRASVLEQIEKKLSSPAVGTKALLFIDLDGFKQVNDSWGHLFGDKVLQKTAQRLRQVFGEHEVYGRVGGDEFLVFLNNVQSRQTVEDKAAQMIQTLPLHHQCGDQEILVTCSVGVALCQNVDTTVERLYEQADKAMYRAKENGKNQIFFHEDL